MKLTAWGSMSASLTLMIVLGVNRWAVLAAVVLMATGAIYVARCPSR